MSCSSGCPTQDHESYGECLRAKSTRVAYCNSATGNDLTRQKKWDAELQAYRDARAEGIQPAGTSMRKIDQAKKISDRTGHAYDASAPPALPTPKD